MKKVRDKNNLQIRKITYKNPCVACLEDIEPGKICYFIYNLETWDNYEGVKSKRGSPVTLHLNCLCLLKKRLELLCKSKSKEIIVESL
jgi:hypothetical protein